MIKVLADTNIWIPLIEDPNEFPLIEIVEKLVHKGVIQLIVPTAVLTEFSNLRENAALKCAKSLNSHI